ncbi:hypothetical protein EMIT019CA3_110053 [Bacillus pseudomycoides]
MNGAFCNTLLLIFVNVKVPTPLLSNVTIAPHKTNIIINTVDAYFIIFSTPILNSEFDYILFIWIYIILSYYNNLNIYI